MRNIFIAALGFSLFYAIPALAGNVKMADRLAQASSPANVKAVALQQKNLYCVQNAKNKQLQGKVKDEYLAACMSKNDALAAFQSISTQRFVASNANELLLKLPTASGNR